MTRIHPLAAAETAHPAQNLPDGAAIRIAVGVASKKEHLAIPPVQYLSREDRMHCNWFVTTYQAVNSGKGSEERSFPYIQDVLR